MRDGALPATVVALAVVAFVAYVSLEGGARAVDFAVVGSASSVVPADDPVVAPEWPVGSADEVLLVDVSWQAADSVGGGSYTLLVAAPRGWRPVGCRPECEWSTREELAEGELGEFADGLPRGRDPRAASFDAEQSGDVTLALAPRGSAPAAAGSVAAGSVAAGWLLQTDGDNVLGAQQVPLD